MYVSLVLFFFFFVKFPLLDYQSPDQTSVVNDTNMYCTLHTQEHIICLYAKRKNIPVIYVFTYLPIVIIYKLTKYTVVTVALAVAAVTAAAVKCVKNVTGTLLTDFLH